MSTTEEAAIRERKKERIIGATFLSIVGGGAMLAGFGRTLLAAKKRDPKFFDKGMTPSLELAETGAMLAMRALAWGSVYAFAGTGIFCYGVWKLSGATNFEEFRMKIGNKLPRLSKNEPPQSRTEFEGLNDLMSYLSTWKTQK